VREDIDFYSPFVRVHHTLNYQLGKRERFLPDCDKQHKFKQTGKHVTPGGSLAVAVKKK
jgi:hypothetical protein